MKKRVLAAALLAVVATTSTAFANDNPERVSLSGVKASKWGDLQIFMNNSSYNCDGNNVSQMVAFDEINGVETVELMTKIALAALLAGREVDLTGEWVTSKSQCNLTRITLR